MSSPSFRLDNLSDFAIARPDDVMFSLDMVQGYYHVNLHPESRTFTGFQWRDRYYVYNVLLFGMATAPRCFAKVMGILVRHWRAQGVRIIAYPDGGCSYALGSPLPLSWSAYWRIAAPRGSLLISRSRNCPRYVASYTWESR